MLRVRHAGNCSWLLREHGLENGLLQGHRKIITVFNLTRNSVRVSNGGGLGTVGSAIPFKQASSNSTMLISNPFGELSASVPPGAMKTYVVIMALLVLGGTLLDVIHKKARGISSRIGAIPEIKRSDRSAGAHGGLAVQTAIVDVMASGEFCNPRRGSPISSQCGVL